MNSQKSKTHKNKSIKKDKKYYGNSLKKQPKIWNVYIVLKKKTTNRNVWLLQ